MFRSILIVALIIISTPAIADSIDGSWCTKDGKHLSINGPEITLPNDAKIQGVYRRHEFLYTVPAGDVDSGKQVYLQLQNEDAMNSYFLVDGKPGDAVAWNRCAVPPKTS